MEKFIPDQDKRIATEKQWGETHRSLRFENSAKVARILVEEFNVKYAHLLPEYNGGIAEFFLSNEEGTWAVRRNRGSKALFESTEKNTSPPSTEKQCAA